MLLFGIILFAVGNIWILVAAFIAGVWWGLCYVFLPFLGALVFVLIRWEKARHGFGLIMFGCVLMIGSVFLVFRLEPEGRYHRALQSFAETKESMSEWDKTWAVMRKLAGETTKVVRKEAAGVRQKMAPRSGFRKDFTSLNMSLTDALIRTVQFGEAGNMEYLLNAGVDINTKTEQGYTILMEAAVYGYKDIAQLLIQRGADPHVRAPDGETALSLAEKNFRADIADMLKEAGVFE